LHKVDGTPLIPIEVDSPTVESPPKVDKKEVESPPTVVETSLVPLCDSGAVTLDVAAITAKAQAMVKAQLATLPGGHLTSSMCNTVVGGLVVARTLPEVQNPLRDGFGISMMQFFSSQISHLFSKALEEPVLPSNRFAARDLRKDAAQEASASFKECRDQVQSKVRESKAAHVKGVAYSVKSQVLVKACKAVASKFKQKPKSALQRQKLSAMSAYLE
jgi:hypothetical protein